MGLSTWNPPSANFHIGLPSRKQRCHCCGWPCRVANSGEELEKFHFMWLGTCKIWRVGQVAQGWEAASAVFFRFINWELAQPSVNPAFFGLSWCSDRRWVPRQRLETIWVRRKFSATKWFWILKVLEKPVAGWPKASWSSRKMLCYLLCNMLRHDFRNVAYFNWCHLNKFAHWFC